MSDQRIWTIPNVLSFLRLLGIPLYLYLVENDLFEAAVLVLMLGGVTDYLDGKLARILRQESRIGELLDPLADRLYILAVLVSFLRLHLIPWWVVAVILGRDLILGLLLIVMKRSGIAPFVVTYLGKAATFNLLYAFPLLLLTRSSNQSLAEVAFVTGWAFSAWGIGLYLLTGLGYFKEGVNSISRVRRSKL